MSYQLAQSAITLGYRKIYWYRGGVNAWAAAGLPTTRFPNGSSAND
jgi:rhodanese-related sulfurtransferase